MSEAKLTARQWALKLPPDVLEHPMPFPVRLDYAEAIINRAQSQAVADAATELSTLRAENERLKNQLQDYQDGMTKVAKSAGLITPLELIMRAKNNEQTYFDIFAEMLATEYANPEQLRALRAEREELVGVLRDWLTAIKPDGGLPSTINLQRQLDVEAKAAALLARLKRKGDV